MGAGSYTSDDQFRDKCETGAVKAWMLAVALGVAIAVCVLPCSAFAKQSEYGDTSATVTQQYLGSTDESLGTATATATSSAPATETDQATLLVTLTSPSNVLDIQAASSKATSAVKAEAAKAKAKTYSIVFKANKGKGKMAKQTIKRGKSVKLAANKFKRAKYVFVGWNTKANGKGKAFKNRQSVKNLVKAGKKVTLYAQWTNKYTVVFKPNKGSGKMASQKIAAGKKATLKKAAFTRASYAFTGWNTRADGKGKAYSDGQLVKNLAKAGKKVVLYAQWTNKYTVSFDANGGSGKMADQLFVPSKAAALNKATFTRAGYLFDGWNAKADGTGRAFADGEELKYAAEPGQKLVLYAQWKKIEKLELYMRNGESEKPLAIGDWLYLYTNNPIAKAEISDPRVLVPTNATFPDTSCYLVASEIGSATVTLTDIYGQTASTTVQVVLSEYSTDWKTSRLNASLEAPVVSSYTLSRYGIGAYCAADFKTGDSSRGYQMYVSTQEDFAAQLLQGKTDYIWNGSGYAYVSVNRGGYSLPSSELYVKLRSYRIVGTVMEYGPWSAVKRVEIPNDAKERSGKAEYSYEVYRLDSSQITSGYMYPIFIKTNNPQPESIRLIDGDQSAFYNIQMWGSQQYFDDIKYANTYDASETLHRVAGGYIAYLKLSTAGTRTLQLRECNKDGYVVAKSITVNVANFDTEFNAWVDGMIAKANATQLNPKEKMDAVVNWIWSHEGFKYPANVNGNLVNLSSEQGPYYKTKVWDSYVSPAVLCQIAARIGGFDEIHNCYGDYAPGTSEWAYMHYKCRVTYLGEQYYYEACPMAETGARSQVTFIDLSNTANLFALK